VYWGWWDLHKHESAPPRALRAIEEDCMDCFVRASPCICNWEFRHKSQFLLILHIAYPARFSRKHKETVQCLPNKYFFGTACAITVAQWMMPPDSKRLKGLNDTGTTTAKR